MLRAAKTAGNGLQPTPPRTESSPLIRRARAIGVGKIISLLLLLPALLLMHTAAMATAQAPLPPTTLVATTYSKAQIDLVWDDPNTGSANESGYIVEQVKGTSVLWRKLFVSEPNVTSWSNIALATGATYSYRVRAYVLADGVYTYSAYSPISTATTQSDLYPNPPTSLVVTSTTTTQIALSWQDSANSQTGYKLERAGTLTGPWTFIGQTGASARSYTDSGLVPGTAYAYRVRATNAVGDSAASNAIATSTVGDGVPPAPGAVTAFAQYGTFVSSPFSLSTPFMSNNVLSSCEYSPNGGFNWIPATISGTGPNYVCTLSGLSGSDGQVLGLQMRATSVAGTGTSTSVTRTVDATAPTTANNVSAGWLASAPTVTLTPGDGSGSGLSSTQYCTDTANSCTPAINGTSIAVNCAAGSVCQTYVRYRSVDNVGNAEATKSALVRVDRLAPADGTLNAAPAGGQIVLSWSGFSDSGSGLSASTPYKLVFATGGFPASCAAGTVLSNGTGTTYTHAGLTNGTTYFYRVCGTDAVGNVSVGATASAKPSTNQSPIANAGSNQATQTLTAITFNGALSSDPDGTIVSYAWAFGDGGIGSGVTSSHAYMTAGTYTATLTITDNLGATGSASAIVTVSNRPPVAQAGPDQTVTLGTSVNFNGSGSSDPDGTITSYAWNFGDGLGINSGNVPTVSHAYSAAGIFTATLTVTDNLGAQSSDTVMITVSSAAAGGQFRWATRFGGVGTANVVYPYAMAVDASGNIVIAGTFTGTVDLGGGPLVSSGSSDIFVAKYSPTGIHQWSKRFGDALDDSARGLTIDPSGNVIMVGAFKRIANFGGSNLVAYYNGVPPETSDLYIAKFSPTGAHLWSRSFGSWGDDSANAVTTDAAGSVFVVGTIQGTVNFGGGDLNTASGSPDIFLAKFSSTGVHQWSQKFGNFGVDAGYGVAVDPSGNVAITGLFRGATDFGGGVLTSFGSADIFLAEYDTNGAHLWSKQLGGTSNEAGYAVVSDVSGNLILTGYVQGTADLGGGPLPSIGSLDTFVAKYSSTGGYVWGKRFGGTNPDEGLGIATDTSGNVLVAGTFQGAADFGSGPLSYTGGWDAFVAKYSPTGGNLWSKSFGSTGDDIGYAVATDRSGNPVMVGNFQNTVNFGGGPQTATGWIDMFILGLAP